MGDLLRLPCETGLISNQDLALSRRQDARFGRALRRGWWQMTCFGACFVVIRAHYTTRLNPFENLSRAGHPDGSAG